MAWTLTLTADGTETRHDSRDEAERHLRKLHPRAERQPGGDYLDASGAVVATLTGRTRRGSTLQGGAAPARLLVSATDEEREAWRRAAGEQGIARWLRTLANEAAMRWDNQTSEIAYDAPKRPAPRPAKKTAKR